MLFYGQDHYDTLAILSMKDDMKETKVADLMSNQKLLSNKDLLIRNFGQLIENLKECEDYIQEVVVTNNMLFDSILGWPGAPQQRNRKHAKPVHELILRGRHVGTRDNGLPELRGCNDDQ